jgi:hypothetical protein
LVFGEFWTLFSDGFGVFFLFCEKDSAICFIRQREAVQSSRMCVCCGIGSLRDDIVEWMLMIDVSEVLFDVINIFWGNGCLIFLFIYF